MLTFEIINEMMTLKKNKNKKLSGHQVLVGSIHIYIYITKIAKKKKRTKIKGSLISFEDKATS
jgi:hypothetical protein